MNNVPEGGETLFPYVSSTGDPINRHRVGEMDRWERMIN
jgi:hypothetical protein